MSAAVPPAERVPPPERDRADIQLAIVERFGANEGLAASYAELLTGAGIDRGMIGPREASRIWERHLLNCAALDPLVPVGSRVVDLGSGAGLPGIPLAIARPDVTVLLLEPMQRRVRFLDDCLAQLALPNVTVLRGRGEDGVPDRADVVVVRAVAALDKLARLSARLLVAGGVLLALKGEGAIGEVSQVRREMRLEVELLSVPSPGQDAIVVRVAGDFAALEIESSDRRSNRGGRA